MNCKGLLSAQHCSSKDVYFFDEPSSYLDIHERMRIVKIIQELSENSRVIVIEHDLAVLDVLVDLIHIVYGRKEPLEYSHRLVLPVKRLTHT